MTGAIVDFRFDHAAAWAQLNTAWLVEGGFTIEAKDRLAIDDPQGVFLDKGGRIFIAEKDGEAMGCCAMVPTDDGVEVCKMTVTPAARGLGLARRLLDACEAAAREMGAARLYLETNSALKPAIALYEGAGFLHLPPRPTPYARADVFMEKRL
ncbi:MULTISPECIES: GNAT family N-acetyltransferase [Brevundimonas]|uniref:GNAT family N-acetyltransferase n=1 Tax=Brevundimonas TaxID=41275 RepID=UPI000701CC7A|nr:MULTISPECIES: GNAT family N-acetyltransferase [Brevundimonas]KQR61528.1 histone acetyltransferase [Brevundimonas sp. Leaf168]WBT04650.1 GNAT family N-acetyltransferase [Brevundimonas vesicularis]